MIRTGIGFDAHGFEEGRPLVIGGVTIPEGPGLSGHSDADVLGHAIADALLGAIGLGDIGDRFPATDEWKGASSLGLLRECYTIIAAAGWKVANVDSTVIAERPKLSSYRKEMSENLARCLDVDAGAVSVKATTTDGMGFTGRGEGIAALAVVTIAAD